MDFNYYMEAIPDVPAALSAPAKMRFHERLMIYTLVAALEPARVLEIGTDEGGTAQIITEAMRYTGVGKLVCLDPLPKWHSEIERAELIIGCSPEALSTCAAGGLFDMALIDGNHEYEAVMADLNGVLPYMANNGRILLHDYLYAPTMNAIRDCLACHEELVDAGALTMRPIDYMGLTQGGLYLLAVKNKA